MSRGDRSAVVPVGTSDDPPEQPSAYDDPTDAEERPDAAIANGLVSLGFITAAVRRSAWLCCTAGAIGLLMGLGLYVALPPTYQATTSVFLTPPPGQNPPDSILTDAALLQTQTVARLAMRKLGLQENVSSFLETYTVTEVTDRILLITASAPSSNEAMSEASALATEFLQFRTGQLEGQQQLVLGSLNQQINQAKQHIKSITAQISQLSAQPASPARQAELNGLRTKRGQATTALTALEQTTSSNQASAEAAITATVKGSEVLDAAAPVVQSRHSRLKHLIIYAFIGLFAGLALSMGIVTVRALVSDRLRRRDDIAYALDAPVRLSVGTVRLRRWLPGRHGLAAARGRDVQRIVAHLRNAVPKSSRHAVALAVVAVDDANVPALSLASLAVSFARQGTEVVLADLCSGAPAARLLGAKGPGVRAVRVNGTRLVIAVPASGDDVAVGPLRSSRRAQPAPAKELMAACASADLLLTLAALDPSLGGEHLATWARDAVVMVTAGRSSWTKINAVGEMIRLASMRLVSAVLVGADKTDESLGLPHTPEVGREGEVVQESLQSDAERFVVAADKGSRRGATRYDR